MPAGNAERRAAHQHAWAGNIPIIDGIAQGNVAVSIGPDVAHRGETGLERDARIAGPGQSLARNRNRQSRGVRHLADSLVR